uniref:Ribonuclease H-like domain-containing protein n=1 Tax=Tanacetum cinerariifolium TaxID=118510 RepID=A0A699I0Z8_TANCI|nr:ribonuclease H-like domain-containing protein [Tanacetum cinerariifolium]
MMFTFLDLLFCLSADTNDACPSVSNQRGRTWGNPQPRPPTAEAHAYSETGSANIVGNMQPVSNEAINSMFVHNKKVFPFGSMTPTTPPNYDSLFPNLIPYVHDNSYSQPTVPTNSPSQSTIMTEPPIVTTHVHVQSRPLQISTLHATPSHLISPVHMQSPQQFTHTAKQAHQSPSHDETQHLNTNTTSRTSTISETNTHHMVTRAKADISKPLERMNYHVTTMSPLPRFHVHALRDLNWKKTILNEYKALITNVNSMGMDCDETFSPVAKLATIRTRSLYRLKQAPRAWFQRFASFATRIGFQHSKPDTSLFVFQQGFDIAYLMLYVDDIILTASSTNL